MQTWNNLTLKYKEYLDSLSNLPSSLFEDVRRVFFFGMGGSGVIGKYLGQYSYEELDFPIFSFNTTKPPRYVKKEDLCIVVSYSGKTKETLSVYHTLKKMGNRIICVSSDGILKEECETFIELPENLLPRESFPYMLTSSFAILSMILSEDFSETFQTFDREIDKIKIPSLSIEEPIIIYSWYSYYPVALRFKQQLNENSKLQAYAQTLSEAAHNEIEGVKMGNFIIIRGKKEEKEYVEAFKKVLPKEPIEISEFSDNYLLELLYLTYIGDKISIELANRLGRDWRETNRIKEYKSFLR